MCRPAHSSNKLLLSQQIWQLSTDFSQLLGLFRALLVKQGFFFPFGNKFMLNEPGYRGTFLVSVKRPQHCASGIFAYGRTLTSYCTPFDVIKRSKPSRVTWKVYSSSNKFMLNEVVGVVGRATNCYQVLQDTLIPDEL